MLIIFRTGFMAGRINNIEFTTFPWFMFSIKLNTSREIKEQQNDHLCSFTALALPKLLALFAKK